MLSSDGTLEPALNHRPVRRFAGWGPSGKHLAFVVVDDNITYAKPDSWAFLLTPETGARDAVVLAAGDGTQPGRDVFSGMRVTFPHWSPVEEKLSLWVTFSPTFRSWLSRIFGWGLMPGDPAAVLDVETGEMTWMAVNAHEKAQVGR